MGRRDLADVLADLDLGGHVAVLVLHRNELVDAAKDRLALGGDQTLADAERVDLCVLHPEILNEVLIERVGNGDGAVFPARLIEHLARLAGEIGDIAAVEANAALFDAQGLQNIIERLDGIGDTGLERVIRIHKQNGVLRVELAVGGKGIVLRVEHLHPGMRHRAERGRAVELVGDGAGSAAAAGDIGGACAVDGGGGALRAAGAELHHGAALGGADDAVGLGRDQALVVDGQKSEGFKQLRLDRGRAHDDHWLLREDGRALGYGVNVAAEVEVCKIVEELLAENTA